MVFRFGKKNRRENNFKKIKLIIASSIIIVTGAIMALGISKKNNINNNEYDQVFSMLPAPYSEPNVREQIEKILNQNQNENQLKQNFEFWREAEAELAKLQLIVEEGTNLEKFIEHARIIVDLAKHTNDNYFLAEIVNKLIKIGYSFENSDEFNPKLIM